MYITFEEDKPMDKEEVTPTGASAVIGRQEQSEWLTRDGCPITPAPWTVRAATFCEDGTPSFEVVMPGSPHMSAVDARIIGAAPALYRALLATSCRYSRVRECAGPEMCDRCAALALVGGPQTKDNDMNNEQVEVEDDRRCGECGSEEAGNCFYCKAD